MKPTFLIRYTLPAVAIVCLSLNPLNASMNEFVPSTEDCTSGGECSCPPGEDCDDEAASGGFNPTFICPFGETDTLDSLMECLADGFDSQGPYCPPALTTATSGTTGDPDQPQVIQPNPPGTIDCNDPMSREDYRVTPLLRPRWGLKIVRLNGTETDRLMSSEHIASILGLKIQVLRGGLVARIARFTQKPSRSGGIITTSVNGTSVVLNTGLYKSADGLSEALMAGVRQAGFKVVSHGDYLYIIGATLTLGTITDLSMVSTDKSVTDTDLALMPLEETGLLLLMP